MGTGRRRCCSRQPEVSGSLPAMPDRGRAVRRQARQRIGGGERGRSGPGGGAVGRDPGGKARAVSSTRVESVRWLRSWRPSRKRGSFVRPAAFSPVQSEVEHTPICFRHALGLASGRRRDPAPTIPRPAGGPRSSRSFRWDISPSGSWSCWLPTSRRSTSAAGVPRGCGGKPAP